MAFFDGPWEGARHDAGIFADSGTEAFLSAGVAPFHAAGGAPAPGVFWPVAYADSAFPLGPDVLVPFRGAALTRVERQFNLHMSRLRICIEWMFARLHQLWGYTHYYLCHKVRLRVCLCLLVLPFLSLF
jgi:hypothetical protein